MKTPLLFLALTGAAAVAAGCGPDPAAPPPVRGEVVVFATVADAEYLERLFSGWTTESGVGVRVQHGEARRIVDAVIRNTENPPADLLWTAGIEGSWRAADEGALRPAVAADIAPAVPDWLRDPDGYWLATGYSRALVLYDADRFGESPPTDYAALADARFRGGLCLSKFALPINQAVIALLIERLGVRGAEVTVRGWMANLGAPVFTTEAELLAALDAGDCAVAITSSAAAALHAGTDSFAVMIPRDAQVQIDAVGVARHARNPEAAVALLEWLASDAVQARHAEALRTFPANADVVLADGYGAAAAAAGPTGGGAGVIIRHADEARLLAERAGYR